MNEYHVTYSLFDQGSEYPHSAVLEGNSEDHVRQRLQRLVDEHNFIKPELKIHQIKKLNANSN